MISERKIRILFVWMSTRNQQPAMKYNLELKEALAALDEKYRIIMILFYSEGYRIREISDILKIPESTVKTRLQRGREKLEVYYKEK